MAIPESNILLSELYRSLDRLYSIRLGSVRSGLLRNFDETQNGTNNDHSRLKKARNHQRRLFCFFSYSESFTKCLILRRILKFADFKFWEYSAAS
jgi:hypothetical protein